MKSVGVYFDEGGMHGVLFNEDGTLLEHHLKPADKVTNEDLSSCK
jgi:hypothetical protein